MKTYIDCIPCFVRQALDAVRQATSNELLHEHVLRQVLQEASLIQLTESPPVMGARIHALIRELTDDKDPYRSMKDKFNQHALQLYPELKEKVVNSADPLETALRFAMAGNVIDLGAKSSIKDKDINRTLENALLASLPSGEVDDFREAAYDAQSILYIGDNTGEIVFDRILIEQLPKENITYVVRGQPVINDVTMVDAQITGMVDVVEVIDNGSGAPGTLLNDCSVSFQRRFQEADLIIAKGQGNYESLSGSEANITFLLMAKCQVIAGDIGCQVGAFILKNSFLKNPADREAREIQEKSVRTESES